MKHRNELERALSDMEEDWGKAPAELAQRIKSEIPADLGEPATNGREEADLATAPARPTRLRLWLVAAAATLIAVGTGLVALRLGSSTPSPASDAIANLLVVQALEPSQGVELPPDLEIPAVPGKLESRPRALEVPPAGGRKQEDEGDREETLRQLQRVQGTVANRYPVPVSQPDAAEGPSPLAIASLELPDGDLAGAAPPARLAADLSRRAPPTPSTGGTHEPNDAPYGDVFFERYAANPFIDTEDDPLSTFGLDVDTASYTVARRFVREGHLPPGEAIRVEELINFFDYGDPAPETGDFAIAAEGAPSPFGEGERYYLLRFNLTGREIPASDRAPATLTFVVDVSGSMEEQNRLGLVKEALRLLLDQLTPEDRVGLVVYGTRGRVLLEPTSDLARIRTAIAALQPEGSTNAEEGLRLGYELAARNRGAGRIDRVILCSDGVANVGRTAAESLLEEIRAQAETGIELTTVGFGMGNYNDVLMEQLADRGNGRYAYVDTLDEAHRIFVAGLTGTLQTIAAEARVQVEMNPEIVARYRLVGYENRDIADARFRDDRVDAGEIGAGHTVTALYEVKLAHQPRRRDTVATLRLRYGSVAAGEMVESSHTLFGRDVARSWEASSPALRLTSLVAEYGEILKQTYWAKSGDLDDLFRRAQLVSAEFPGDAEVADFVSLVGRAAALRARER